MSIVNILGVFINNLTIEEATQKALLFMEQKNKSPKLIFTPNPEFVLNALKDKEFMEILNKSDLNVADGIGVVIGAKILKTPLKERVSGYDLVQNLFAHMKEKQKTVFFLGSCDEVIEKAKQNMEKKYNGLKVVGVHNGYFDENLDNIIIEKINASSPNLLLVGLGSPKQEKWIFKNKEKLNANLIIGVGGSFDVMSGNVKRAPKIFIKLNLEWFYRLLSQPSRFGRIAKLPLFLVYVLKCKFKGDKNDAKQ